MSGRQARKMRREIRKWWNDYLLTTAEFPLSERLKLAWRIVRKKKFGDI